MRDIEQGIRLAGDGWLTVKQHENGFPVVYQARDEIPQDIETENLSNMLTVVWPFESDGSDGLPGDDVMRQQADFEKILEGSAGVLDDACLMLQITGKSKKEWLWYVRDPMRWQESIAKVVDGDEAYPISIVCYDAEDWKIYKQIRAGMDTLSGKEA